MADKKKGEEQFTTPTDLPPNRMAQAKAHERSRAIKSRYATQWGMRLLQVVAAFCAAENLVADIKETSGPHLALSSSLRYIGFSWGLGRHSRGT